MSVFKGTKSVIELTPSDFDKNGKIIHPALDNKKGLVCMTCSWCHYCKELKKPYSETSNVLGSSFPMFNLDCVKYSEFSNKLGITSYPTIKYIDRSGKLYKNFTGERSVQGFFDDICKEAQKCA